MTDRALTVAGAGLAGVVWGRVRVGGRPAHGDPEGLIGDAAAKGAIR